MKTVKIRDKEIGDGFPPYFVAELGICHGGDVETAKANAKAAVKAGADMIKTETFYETDLYDDSLEITVNTRNKHYSVPLREHMRRYQFTLEEHHEVKKYCDELNVPFMATAHRFDAVDFLVDMGAEAIKIASPDLVYIPLLRYVAKTGIVMFVDTGGAYQHEVELAVKAIRDSGCTKLVLNHNPSGHPAPPEKHDLRIIPRYKELFDIPVGISDHYDGYEMVIAATVIGANAIEKPISKDRFTEEVEHIWAVNIKDLEEVIRNMHNSYKALGRSARPMGPKDRPDNPHRVALIAKKDLERGDEINMNNIVCGKPRMGIGVEHWDLLGGRKLRVSKKKGSYIQWEDI